MSPPRIGLIGARRRRQGLGPFVARDLAAAGASVSCFLGTCDETLAPAARALFEHAGVEARGYTDLEEMLARESLEALAILSPADTHELYLRVAAQHDLHVLCEKPLVWGGERLLERARTRVEAFRSRGLLLAENCQWPYTLDAFRALHPETPEGPPRRFGMRLSPVSSGAQLLGDCLPHPLSILQDLTHFSRPTLQGVRYTALTPDLGSLELSFDYRVDSVCVHVDLQLRHETGFPRAASLEIDGRRAEREIRLPSYEIAFTDAGRSVSLEDPLTARIRAFVADLEAVLAGTRPPDPSPMEDRMEMLESLLDAYRQQLEPRGNAPPRE